MRSQLLAALAFTALLFTANSFQTQAADPYVSYGSGPYGYGSAPKFPPPAPAKVTISLPEDAVLLFNGVAAKGDGKSRTYLTPALLPGQPYVYEITAMVVRGRQLVVATERVVVWSGEESKVTFGLPAAPEPVLPTPKKPKD